MKYTNNENGLGSSSSAVNRSKSGARPSSGTSNLEHIPNPPVDLTFTRSQLVKEFGTENKHGHLNCFLNVCLQALWQFPKVRFDLQSNLLTTRDAPGSSQIKGFINSLQDFYEGVFTSTHRASNSDVPVFLTNKVRSEFFKLNYARNEFQLHDKADAFEALDQILGIIHAWQTSINHKGGEHESLSNCLRLPCDEKVSCFVHQSFGVTNICQEVCKCGALAAVEYQDSNLFALTINTVEVLNTLANLTLRDVNKKYSYPDKEEQNVIASNQRLIGAQKFCMSKEKESCSEVGKQGVGHVSSTRNSLTSIPEVFMFNVSWNDEPIPSQILKFMISIPERFQINDIFDSSVQGNCTYILKGMIAFQAAHYLSFFRRIFMKMDYLGADYSKLKQTLKEMKREVRASTEWTIFDDAVVDHKGSWSDVVKQCVELRTYPTVIFYERVDPNEEQPESFAEMRESEIVHLLRCSKNADTDYVGFSDGFSQEDILRQIELANSFQKTKSEIQSPSPNLIVEETKDEYKPPKPIQVAEQPPQMTLAQLKKKYQVFGIYLFSCNRCDDGLHALHRPKCLKPGCGSENHFLEEEVCTDMKMWFECLQVILKIQKWSNAPIQPVKKIQAAPVDQDMPVQPIQNLNKDETKPIQQNENVVQPPNPYFFPPVNIPVEVLNRSVASIQSNGEFYSSKPEQSLKFQSKHVGSTSVVDQDNVQLMNRSEVFSSIPDQIQQHEPLYPNLQIAPQKSKEEVKQASDESYVTPGNPDQDIKVLPDPDVSYLTNNGEPNLQDQERHPDNLRPDKDKLQKNRSQNSNDSQPRDESEILAPLPQQQIQNQKEELKESQSIQNTEVNQIQRDQKDSERLHVVNRHVIDDEDPHFDDLVPPNDEEKNFVPNFLKTSVTSKIGHEPSSQPTGMKEVSDEMHTMFKCPKCNLYSELQEPCVECKKSMMEFESKGYPLDELIVEVRMSIVYAQIQERHLEAQYQEKKAQLRAENDQYQLRMKQSELQKKNASEPAPSIRTVLIKKKQETDQLKQDATQKEADFPYWKCYKCNFTNEVQIKICGGCNKDSISQSRRTNEPQPPIRKEKAAEEPPTKNEIYANEKKPKTKDTFGENNSDIQNEEQEVAEREQPPSIDRWSCLNCGKTNFFKLDKQCYYCSSYKSSKEPISDQLKQKQEAQQEKEKRLKIALQCYNCPKQRENMSETLCKDCLTKKEDQNRVKKCAQCGLNEKFKQYDECKKCRLKNHEAKEYETKRLQEAEKQLQLQEEETKRCLEHEQEKLREEEEVAQIKLKKALTCGICRKQKESASLKVCCACQSKNSSVQQNLKDSLCLDCGRNPRDNSSNTMCSDCLNYHKKKFYCSECEGKKESQFQDKCNSCRGVKVYEPLSDLCIKCKTKEQHKGHNMCMSCIVNKKYQLEKCAHCNLALVQQEGDLCSPCESTAQKQKPVKTCQRCTFEVHSGEDLCNFCKSQCSCGRYAISNGDSVCFECQYEAKSQKNLRPSTGQSTNLKSAKSDSSKKQKERPFKCPDCKKRGLVNIQMGGCRYRCNTCSKNYTEKQVNDASFLK